MDDDENFQPEFSWRRAPVLLADRLGVRTAAAVIATDGDRADADAVVALRERFIGVAVLAPPMHRVPGGRSVPDEVGVAGVVVELVGEGSSVGLAVRVAG